MSTQDNRNNMVWAAIYFVLATILSGVFIGTKFEFYDSVNQMILSGSIAGGKWLIQIITVFIFLQEKKWEFIKRIGWVCFIGSCVLFLYNIFWYLPLPLSGFSLFILSIMISVLVMINMYYKAVRKMGLPIKWFGGWMLCLGIAISLQITVVFK